MKEYDVYLFDFDGTLFDTKLSLRKVWRDAFGAVGHEVSDEECDHYMHQNLFQTLEEVGIEKDDYPAFGEALTASLDEEETIAKNVPFPETVELLRTLKERKKTIGIVSGNSVKHISLVLEHWDFPVSVDVLMGSDIYKNGKPSPEPLLFALRELGVEPGANVLYVGDSLQDIEASDAAGVDSVLIDRDGEYPGYSRSKIVSLLELLPEGFSRAS